MDGRCLKELGCKGPETRADCYSRHWNSDTNWCIGANAICIGCTEKGFPDKFSPFYDGEGHHNEGEDKKDGDKEDEDKREEDKKDEDEKDEDKKDKDKKKKDKKEKDDDD